MAKSSTEKTSPHTVEAVRNRVQVIRGWAERTIAMRDEQSSAPGSVAMSPWSPRRSSAPATSG